MKNAFHAYDIRGIYGTDFTKQDIYKIGYFVPKLLNTDTIVIGRDGRVSSPEIHDALTKGITDAGADVHDIGLTTTPMVYFATANYKYKAGIQITASHNPKEYNGLKISRTDALPVGLDSGLDQLLQMATTQKTTPAPKKGTATAKDITDDYIKFQQKYTTDDFNNLKIGVDISNGAAAQIIKKIWKYPFQYINEKLDGTFPAHSPNPLMPENTAQMQQLVKDNKLDAGAVFDGDADRIVFIDDKGRHIPPDLIIAAMGEYFFDQKQPDGQIIQDIRTSKAVAEHLQKYNAKMHMWKVGRANAAPRLRQINGLYGGEYAGHYYFRDFFYSDSGIMAGSIMLQVVAKLKKNGQTLSQLIDQIRQYHNSGEINFKIEDKQAAMERVKNHYTSIEKPTAYYDFDGYRVEYKDWWFNIRKSNTEPYLRLLCEANTRQLLDQKIAEITKLIMQ